MEPGDDQALWRLLGRADAPEVSPYFSRRVLREVAQAREEQRHAANRPTVGGWLAGWRRALRGPRAAVWPGAVIVGGFWLAVVLTTNPRASKPSNPAARPDAPVATATAAAAMGSRANPASAPVVEVAPQDVEVIADLDTTITREANRLWTEDSARF